MGDGQTFPSTPGGNLNTAQPIPVLQGENGAAAAARILGNRINHSDPPILGLIQPAPGIIPCGTKEIRPRPARAGQNGELPVPRTRCNAIAIVGDEIRLLPPLPAQDPGKCGNRRRSDQENREHPHAPATGPRD